MDTSAGASDQRPRVLVRGSGGGDTAPQPPSLVPPPPSAPALPSSPRGPSRGSFCSAGALVSLGPACTWHWWQTLLAPRCVLVGADRPALGATV
ncbi:hypothetical protein PAL_GLEAN10022808 [Pteropus alecto]|uniref:Uncharacterized protein n=1 Tax=Pteropus alecto TaxID=9402 RepID=L5K7R6_PTEAL|nr:hypothetical protein PAL_GLEAN10022808 [Pteropus alecto]